MLRSLRTAALGMTAQQLNVDTIAHNLANVNTTGYKKSTVEFQDFLYDNIESGDVNMRIRCLQNAVSTTEIKNPQAWSFHFTHINNG